jgi:hypothetical protein
MPDVASTFGLRPNNVIPTLDEWDYVTFTAEISAVKLGMRGRGKPSPYWLTESGVNHLAYGLSAELRRKINEEVIPAFRAGAVLVYPQQLVEQPEIAPTPDELKLTQYKARTQRKEDRELRALGLYRNPVTGEIAALPPGVYVALTAETKAVVQEVVEKSVVRDYPIDRVASIIRRQNRKEDDSPYR